jgi:DNA-binding response OmpR family regulator
MSSADSMSPDQFGRILYVEDTPEDQRMLAEAATLAGVPLEIVPVGTAEAALDRLSDRTGFHALVLDWNLPSVTGAEFLESVRALDSKLPVLILTGEPATVDLPAAMQLGAETVYAKPPTLDHWVRLARLLHGFCEDIQASA